MPRLKIYGVAASRAFRTLWMAEELGVDYEHVKTGWADGGCRTPEFLQINPNGQVPAIDDDGVVLWESLAINLYLARKYDSALSPRNVAEEGGALQWSFWVATEVEKPMSAWGYNRISLPPEKRNEQVALDAEQQLKKPLAVLDAALAPRSFLVGDRFTVADLNVAAVLFRAQSMAVIME